MIFFTIGIALNMEVLEYKDEVFFGTYLVDIRDKDPWNHFPHNIHMQTLPLFITCWIGFYTLYTNFCYHLIFFYMANFP